MIFEYTLSGMFYINRAQNEKNAAHDDKVSTQFLYSHWTAVVAANFFMQYSV